MATAAGPLTNQTYSYDNDGRLVQSQDKLASGSTCAIRGYGFDANSNRTVQTVATAPIVNSTCGQASSPSTIGHSYNTGDQLVDAGYTYDAYGRTLTAPAADVSGAGDMSLGYFTNGMIASQTQNGTSDTFTLDPAQNRTRTETLNASGHTLIDHYTGGGDSPAWTDNGDGTWTRNVPGIDGNLAATQSSTGTITLQLPDLHGNIGATAPNDSSATGPTATFAYTEFGTPEPGTTPPPVPYGMLGAKQRSTQDLGGLTLMGIRLYDPNTGRFLQTDPVPGGNANPYDYCNADPINCTDLTGQWRLPKWVKKAVRRVVVRAVAWSAFSVIPHLGGNACVSAAVGGGATGCIGWSAKDGWTASWGITWGLASSVSVSETWQSKTASRTSNCTSFGYAYAGATACRSGNGAKSLGFGGGVGPNISYSYMWSTSLSKHRRL